MKRLASVLSALALLVPAGTLARTWHVAPDGSGDAPTIQAGIDSAAVGDTVLLACGTYYERNIDLKSDITVRSESGDPDCAVLDAGFVDRLFSGTGLSAGTRIEGLTLTHGRDPRDWPENCGGGMYLSSASPVIADCVFEDNACGYDGGGLWCAFGSTPRIERCVFRNNHAGHSGGGLYCWELSHATVVDCIFQGNDTAMRGGGGAVHGSSNAVFTNCSFLNNHAAHASGAGGGGVNSMASSPTLMNCLFEGNDGADIGGGFLCWEGSTPKIRTCVFRENSALIGGGAGSIASSPDFIDCQFLGNHVQDIGGGIYCESGGIATVRSSLFDGNSSKHGGGFYVIDMEAELTDCRFYENSAIEIGGGLMAKVPTAFLAQDCLFYMNRSSNGGGVAFWEGYTHPRLVGCTLSHNSAPTGGAAYGKQTFPEFENCILSFSGDGSGFGCFTGASPTFTCTDIYGNADGDWVDCIEGQSGTDGNSASDPRFCDANNGDFTLEHGSPCLNAPGCGLVGAFGEGCGGSTAVEVVSWGSIKQMFR